MAGERSDHEPSNGVDEEELAESTIAMGAPSFDPALLEGVPSPISEPPPAPTTPPAAALPSPHTAPQGFSPVASSTPGVPKLRAKAASSPMVPTPLGGITPGPAAAPTSAAAAPPPAAPAPAAAARPDPSTAQAAAARPRVRAQTVIGLAPAPPGAPRPVAVRPATGSNPKAQVPAIAKKPTPSDPGQDPFGLDAGAAEAARAAAFAPGPRAAPVVRAPSRPDAAPAPAARAPSRPDAAPAPVAAEDSGASLPTLGSTPPKAGDQTATLAVPRDRLPPSGSGLQLDALLPVLGQQFDKDEETMARPAEVPRVYDARVVRDDVGGDDETLAVGPQSNPASHQLSSAFAQTMAHDGMAPAGFAPVSSRGPAMTPSQPMQAWGGGGVQGRPSDPQMGRASQPGFAPPSWQGAAQGHGGMPMQHPHAAQPNYGQPMAPSGHQAPQQARHQAPQQAPHQPMQPRPGMSLTWQIVIVAAVGVICVAVFIVGVYLFVTKT